MKKLNQKGFSVVEILIVIVVVGLLGAVGWLVYDRQSKNNDSSNKSQTSSTAPTDTTTKSETSGKALEIAALGIKVNDPDGRNLQVHTEKICAAECDTEDSYFIRDNNDAYFSRCEYPAGISILDASNIKDMTDIPDSDTAKHTKKIGNDYFYVFPGSHFQSPCDKLQDGDEQYEDGVRQYIVDNIVKI